MDLQKAVRDIQDLHSESDDFYLSYPTLESILKAFAVSQVEEALSQVEVEDKPEWSVMGQPGMTIPDSQNVASAKWRAKKTEVLAKYKS